MVGYAITILEILYPRVRIKHILFHEPQSSSVISRTTFCSLASRMAITMLSASSGSSAQQLRRLRNCRSASTSFLSFCSASKTRCSMLLAFGVSSLLNGHPIVRTICSNHPSWELVKNHMQDNIFADRKLFPFSHLTFRGLARYIGK